MTAAPARLPGVLLTGGRSRRLGVDKATLRLPDGTTLAARAAAILDAVCAPCVEVGDGVSGLRSVREQPPGGGPLAALLAGADALATTGPVILLACDHARVDHALLMRILRAPAAHGTPGPPDGDAIAATPDGRLHFVCARYSTATIAEARTRFAAGERALRWVAGRPHVTVAAPAELLADVDTPADARALGIAVAGLHECDS